MEGSSARSNPWPATTDALPIVSTTGQGSASGDIPAVQTLGAFGQTMLAAVGVQPSVITQEITSGSVVTGALTSVT